MDDKQFELVKWVAGILIGFITALASYILFLHNRQAKERSDNRDERMKSTEKTTDALNKNTDILTGLKTLLEHRNR